MSNENAAKADLDKTEAASAGQPADAGKPEEGKDRAGAEGAGSAGSAEAADASKPAAKAAEGASAGDGKAAAEAKPAAGAKVAKPAGKAKAAKAATKPAGAPKPAKAKGGASAKRLWVPIAMGVVCLVLGGLIGHFAIAGGPAAIGSATIAEGDLSKTIATYSSAQGSGSLTVRDVYDANGSLQSSKQTDGSYTAPSADAVLTAARNKILTSAAEAQGLQATDDDITAYAKETFGSDSLDTLATTYSTDADTVKALLRQTVLQSKLREQVVGSGSVASAPTAPQAPKSGKTTAESKAYADYIIKLAGDEWDKDKGTWKSKDGTYAQALQSYDVSAKKASYEAAQAAYNVAYSQYTSQSSSSNSKWTDYVNGLLTASSIQIGTIGS